MQDQMHDSNHGVSMEPIESCKGVPQNIPSGNPWRSEEKSGELNSQVEEIIISESRKLKE